MLTPNLLHRFPILKGSFDCMKIPRLVIVRVVFDGGPCPCKSAAPSWAYSIFGENFRKRVSEFAITTSVTP